MNLELSQIEMRYAGLRATRPERDAQLRESLLVEGQRTPVLVVEPEKESSRYVLIDGYARVRACKKVGLDIVKAQLIELREPEALLWHHLLQSGPRRHALEDGWLINELVEVHGWALSRIAYELGRTVSWVSRRIGLVTTLPEAAQERVRSGQLTPQAAMKFLLPLARANRRHCEELLEQIGKERLSVRQYETLYLEYRRSDGTRRQRLVDEPLLYLRARRATDISESLPEHQLTDAFRRLAESSWQAQKRIQQLGSGVDFRPSAELNRAWSAAREAYEALRATAQTHLPMLAIPHATLEDHAGSGHPPGHSASGS